MAIGKLSVLMMVLCVLPLPARADEGDKLAGRPVCSTAQAKAIAIADVLEVALESQPQLLIAQEAVEKARANLIAARSPFLPSVTLSLQSERFVPSTITQPVQIGNTIVGGTNATKTTYGSVGLNWNLYGGGRDAAGYRASQSDLRASQAGLTHQIDDTVAGVLTAYTDIYKAQRDADAQARMLVLQQSIEQRAEQQFKQGTTTTLAIAQAQTSVLETSRALYQACRTVADKSAALAQAVGLHLEFDQLYQIDEPLPEPIDHSINNLEWAKIVQDDPAVVAAKDSVAAADYKLKQAKAAYGPTVSLEGRKDYLGQDVESWRAANHITPNSYRIGLQIQQPILPLTSEYSAVRAAKSDLRKAQASYEQALLDVEAKYHTAFNASREADASLTAAEHSLAQANELLSLTQSLFASGRVDKDKVEQAQIVVAKATSAVSQATSEQRLAHWLIHRVNDPQAFPTRVLKQFSLADRANFP
jgi:outer membrane protein TolC